ncbi:MAG: LPS export ABC transporter periplasmic protein LptC [Chitinophagaceae bacterium]
MTNNHKIHFKIQAALLIGCLFLLGCENDEETINAWTEKKLMVERATGITSLFSQEGIMKARLKAPLMLRYQADTISVEFPNTLQVEFFDSAIRVESWVNARYGKYFENFNKVVLRDDVRVININGDTLTTSELWWDQNQKQFYTDSAVRITGKDKRIRGGKGLVASQDLNEVLIKYPTGMLVINSNTLPQ